MLGFFRNNQFSTAILLAIYIALLRLPAFLGVVQPGDSTCSQSGALSLWLCQLLQSAPFFSALASGMLVWLQASLLNTVCDTNRLAADRTWFPGVGFALVASALPEFLFFSPALLAVTFVILSLRSLFATYKQQVAMGDVFDTAFWLAVAGLVYPPALILIVSALIGLGILRSFNFRERLVFLSGCFVPFYLVWLWYFWNEQGDVFWNQQFASAFGLFRFDMPWTVIGLLKSANLLIYLLFAIMGFGIFYHKKLIQVQKYISILYWFLTIGLLGVMLHKEQQAVYFLLVSPMLGAFLGLLLLSIRNRALAEILHLALIGFVLFIQFAPMALLPQ